MIPPELIIRDITARSQNLVVRSPIHGETVFEFRSSKQELQDLGKIQLSSVWHDEETPKDKREECRMRLLAENGDEVFSLTPTNALSYTFSDVWQRADYIFRTSTIAKKYGLPQEENKGTKNNIACIQMATDDNPSLTKESIESMFAEITDPDVLAIRRYGVFKQISGRIFKSYDPSFCYLPYNKTFPNGVPYEWLHCRGIDYHDSRIPWSIGWMSCSPKDEWFLWREFHPAIDGPVAYNTYEIAKAMVRKSEDYLYSVNLIDPLANAKQPNTLFSVTDDLNRYFEQIRQEEQRGMPSWWQGWDTKGTGGRDEIAKRFKNAVRCGKPFNNAIREKGILRHLPTLWIMDSCPAFHHSIMNWCYAEWVTGASKMIKDQKTTPQQKHSHDCMVLEALGKDGRVLHAATLMKNRPPSQHYKSVSVTGR
jgi:hypothetical protein